MINIKKIGIGTVQFGLNYGISNKKGKTKVEEINQILETAREKGVETIDTASAYGNAEELLGNYNLDEFKIISKFMPSEKGDSISNQFNNTLKKLKLSSIYAYLAHRPMSIIKNPEQWKELQQFKSDGKVQKIGFSLNEPEEINELLKKGFIPDLIQVPYNYFDRRFEEIMINLSGRGCEIHSRSTFLQGLFFMDVNKLAPFFDEVKPNLKLLNNNKTLPKSLLSFVTNKNFINKVIIGVENNNQLKDNLNNSIEIEELEDLNFDFSKKIMMPMFWPK
ncbi:aldo/keto reductase [Polaribacter haliotis]|uniref:Aldo/keto reductase n=1 Tax=Polaribacter haliotis TaxID=1888915 RepID=A0A7L8AJ98_9FLAO|nr:aldo/keto reductase [Polaribacter haliotis]QOD62086.1 aldo/keto reductase [Polaribacter haliotis]